MSYQPTQETWPAIVVWAIRHWFLVLILVGALITGIYELVHENESEQPRPGYYDTGETLTESECLDQGGQIVDDVCYSG